MEFGQEAGVPVFPLLGKVPDRRCPKLPVSVLAALLRQQRRAVVVEWIPVAPGLPAGLCFHQEEKFYPKSRVFVFVLKLLNMHGLFLEETMSGGFVLIVGSSVLAPRMLTGRQCLVIAAVQS